MARVLIGTSGWHYESWRGPFFPKGLPLKQQLEYYSRHFETTELNGVFYRTPSFDAVEGFEIHYPLEAAVGQFGQQPRPDRGAAEIVGRQGWPGAVSAAAEFRG